MSSVLVRDYKETRPKVYQAGPIDLCSINQIHDWRDDLKNRYPEIDWLDPSRRSYSDPQVDWFELVQEDLYDIQSSDGLLAYVWKTSGGTSMELVHSYSILHIPTVVVVDDLTCIGPWVRFHSNLVTDSFEDAVEYLKIHCKN